MSYRNRFLAFLFCLSLAMAGVAPAAADTWRIGTVAPDNSPWTNALHKLAARWAAVSDGKIWLKIYPGGTAGDEQDLVRKMRIGQLQGAALTQLGMGLIDGRVLATSVPFLIRDQEEMNAVMERLEPLYSDLLEQKGVRLLFWASAGWVRFFSREPIVYPQDVKRMKLAVPETDIEVLESLKRMGFQAFPLPLPDFLTGLQTGMVDVIFAPPSVVAAFQWFGPVRHMSALKVAPTFGGVVIASQVWERVPEDLRARLLEEGRRIGMEMDRASQELDREAEEAMRERGLIIDPVPPEADREWRRLVGNAIETLADKILSQEILDQIRGTLAEHRQLN